MDRSIVGWRAYYRRVSYGSRDHTPTTLPVGVVRIVEYFAAQWAPSKPYRRIVPKGDWYWWDGEHWQSSGTGEWGTWQPKPRPDAIRSTARIPEQEYDRIMADLMAATDLP